MILDGRFPRLSPDGQHVACGALVVSIDGVAIGPGTTPVWVDTGSILYTRQPDGALMLGGADRTPIELRPAGHEPSSLCCDGRGRFAFRDAAGVWTSDRNLTVTGAFRPTWAGLDLCWCLDTGTTAELYREGTPVAKTVHDVRGMPDGRLCFIQVDGTEQWTCVQLADGTIQSWRLVGAQEYHPLVLDLLGEPWVVSHTRDDRLLLRTGNNGIVLATGATFEPDAVVRADGTVRLVWADDKGRLVDRLLTPLTKTMFWLTGEGMAPETRIVRDLRAQPPPDTAPWPPSGKGWTRRDDITEIDMVSYWLGSEDWSRNGMHVAQDGVTYSHPFQSRTGAGWVQHTKFGPPDTRAATWTFTSKWIGLAFDGTNELELGYHFYLRGTKYTAALYPRVMQVGAQHRRVVEIDIVDRATPNDPPRRVTWAGWIAAIWQNDAPIGDLPAGTLHAEILFDPAFIEGTGWRERNVCAEHVGCWYWDRHRKTPNAVPDMRWVGTRNAPRVPDIPVQFPDAAPVDATPTPDPDPDPDPEPDMPIPEPTITDAEARDAGGRIEHHYDKYADRVGYQKREVHTDPLSYVWAIRYYQDRQRGKPHEPAIQTTERGMAQAIGVLEPDVPPVDPGVPPDPHEVPPVVPLIADFADRVLRTATGALYDYRESSCFALLAFYRGQNGGSPEAARAVVQHMRRRHRMTEMRVLALFGTPYWTNRGWRLHATDPGLHADMAALTRVMLEEGVRPRWTLLADVPETCPTKADQVAHVQACALALAPYVERVIVELCNEPTMNGFSDDWPVVLADIARRIDQRLLIALGADNGITGHLPTADREPADLVYFHVERVISEGGWAWCRRMGEYGVVLNGVRPAGSGEPVNAGHEGAPGDFLRDPAIWFCYGALSRIVPRSGYFPTMHYDDGIFARIPEGATVACFDAFNAGCDAVPLDAKLGQWVNGHWAEAPWRGYDQTDPPSDNRPTRIYGRIVNGVYYGVTIREPKGWTWRDLRYPVERIATWAGETFDCSVWRGRVQ